MGVLDNFGTSVSLSSNGKIVAIGARFNNGAALNAGHVRVFAFKGTTWSQLGTDLDGEAKYYGLFGSSVSLSLDAKLSLWVLPAAEPTKMARVLVMSVFSNSIEEMVFEYLPITYNI